MKVILLTVLMLATFKSVYADTKMDDKTCQSLATDASVTLFATANNADLYNAYSVRREKESYDYIEAIKKNLSENYKKLCDSKKDNITVEEFMAHQQNTCGSQCDADSKMFKTYLIGKNGLKDRVVGICKDLCGKSYQKLEFLKLGTNMGKESAGKASPDCSGAVSDKGRGVDVKAIEFNVDTGTTTINTSEK